MFTPKRKRGTKFIGINVEVLQNGNIYIYIYIDADLYIHEVPIGKSLEGIPRRVNGDTVVMKFLNYPSISVPFEFD